MQTKTRKQHRVFLWVFLAVQLVMLIWLIGAIHSENHLHCSQYLGSCASQHDAAGTIGAAIVVFFWLAVDAVLGVSRWVYLSTRRHKEDRL